MFLTGSALKLIGFHIGPDSAINRFGPATHKIAFIPLNLSRACVMDLT